MPSVQKVSRSDAGLASELRVAVVRLRRRLINERDPESELGIGSMAVLGCLFRKGPLTIGELAAAEQVKPPSMTRTVTRLEEAGYVTRSAHETDGRAVVVALAEAGRKALLADRARREAWLACRLRELTAEERDVLRLAAPLLAKLADR